MAIYWRLVNNSPSNVLQRLVYLCHSHLETAVFCTHLRVHSEQHTGGLYVHPTGQREIIITKGRVNNGAEGGAGTLAHMSRKARTGHKGEEGRGTSGTE
jgi:hypothetical protein